jgi:DNA polymerase-3 subunit epsilon
MIRARRNRAQQYEDWRRYMAARADSAHLPALRTYYGAPLPPAGTAIGDVPLVALDIETTGLDPRRDAIVSIGVVPFTLRRIPLADRRYWVVHPPCDLNSRSITLHHITHADVERAPDFGEVLPQLLEAMAGRVAVVHYRTIERSFLDAAVTGCAAESFGFPSIDTMELEARRHRKTLWARWLGRLGRPPVSIRLHDSRARYRLPHYQAHHALVDALATAELFQAQIATHYAPDTPVERFCR